MKLLYVTSNKEKIKLAQMYLSDQDIQIEAQHLDLEEIQSNSGEEIIKRKAEQAFSTLKKPLIVTDHFWNIKSLNGFPGAYMKYINQWFTPQDFLNLMRGHQDRTVFLEEHLYFTNGKTNKLFFQSIKGIILTEVKGEKKYEPAHKIISLRQDKKSIAECIEQGIPPRDDKTIWQELVTWLTETSATEMKK